MFPFCAIFPFLSKILELGQKPWFLERTNLQFWTTFVLLRSKILNLVLSFSKTRVFEPFLSFSKKLEFFWTNLCFWTNSWIGPKTFVFGTDYFHFCNKTLVFGLIQEFWKGTERKQPKHLFFWKGAKRTERKQPTTKITVFF